MNSAPDRRTLTEEELEALTRDADTVFAVLLSEDLSFDDEITLVARMSGFVKN